MKLIGVDVGGTFTDLVLADTDTAQAVVHKVLTTPEDQEHPPLPSARARGDHAHPIEIPTIFRPCGQAPALPKR
jgi:N-methylhydantoinase A/oxoprolinase/acetone carboxylase beta subunit